MPKKLDLTGERYGFLQVMNFAGLSNGGRKEKLWACRCDCGNEKIVRQNNLRSGHTKSCGCHMKNQCKIANRKHGYTKTPTYISWCNMKARCLNPNSTSYADYGGRGIEICKTWKESFEAFLKDMGEKPSPNYSIERIDANGNYEPGNCKWATSKEQTRNYRRNIHIEYEGRTQCLKDWEADLGMNPGVLNARLKAGWPVEKALSIPVELSNKPWYKRK